jgi:hypothetical protein
MAYRPRRLSARHADLAQHPRRAVRDGSAACDRPRRPGKNAHRIRMGLAGPRSRPNPLHRSIRSRRIGARPQPFLTGLAMSNTATPGSPVVLTFSYASQAEADTVPPAVKVPTIFDLDGRRDSKSDLFGIHGRAETFGLWRLDFGPKVVVCGRPATLPRPSRRVPAVVHCMNRAATDPIGGDLHGFRPSRIAPSGINKSFRV